jgi:hypothetical protein
MTAMTEEDINRLVSKLGPAVAKALRLRPGDDGTAPCPTAPGRPPRPLPPQVMHATADPEG